MLKLIVVVLICTVRLAHADSVDGPKDPRVALGLSVGGTAASLALTFGALGTGHDKLAIAGLASTIVTPSLGEWYAGKPVTRGMGLRLGGGLLFLAAGVSTLDCLDISFDGPATCSVGDALILPLLLYGGWLGYAAGTALDIKNAPSTAREYNAAHRIRVAPTPLYLRTPSGSEYATEVSSAPSTISWTLTPINGRLSAQRVTRPLTVNEPSMQPAHRATIATIRITGPRTR